MWFMFCFSVVEMLSMIRGFMNMLVLIEVRNWLVQKLCGWFRLVWCWLKNVVVFSSRIVISSWVIRCFGLKVSEVLVMLMIILVRIIMNSGCIWFGFMFSVCIRLIMLQDCLVVRKWIRKVLMMKCNIGSVDSQWICSSGLCWQCLMMKVVVDSMIEVISVQFSYGVLSY